jgi:hypothetical protein
LGGEQNLTKKGISFWPDADEDCSENFGIGNSCRLDLFNQSNVPIITVEGRGYKAKEVRSYFENDNTYDSRIKQMFQIYDIPGVKGGVFQNLAIPIIAIFTTKIATANELIYNQDPGPFRRNQTFYPPDQTIYRGGDGRCSTYSQLIFPLKWAIDHEENLTKNGPESTETGPVKFVEFCSLKNQKISPYDHPLIDQVSIGNFNFTDGIYNKNYFDRLGQIDSKFDQELKIEKNEYIGLGCKCLDNREGQRARNSGGACDHTEQMSDENLVHFVGNSLANFQQSDFFRGVSESCGGNCDLEKDKILDAKIEEYFDGRLDQFLENCEMIFG